MKLKIFVASRLKNHLFLLGALVYAYNFIVLYGKLYLKKILGRYRRINPLKFEYPTELQLPITYSCNCDCVMCGMKELPHTGTISPEALSRSLRDPLFSQIRSVGVNGGEPFLLRNLEDYISVLLDTLPKLSTIYIITNGSLNRMPDQLKRIKFLCGQRGVRLYLSVSLDGIGRIHDAHRKKDGLFRKVESQCDRLSEDTGAYCDGFGLICTITRENIYYMAEVDSWTKQKGLNISYNVATIHKRLYNHNRYDSFSVLTDERARSLATEFFYGKYRETAERKYFALYYYLRYHKRISGCAYHNRGVTVTPEGNIAYCATYSDTIGNALRDSAQAFFKERLNYRGEIVSNFCESCSHYTGALTYEGEKLYICDFLKCKLNPFTFLI